MINLFFAASYSQMRRQSINLNKTMCLSRVSCCDRIIYFYCIKIEYWPERWLVYFVYDCIYIVENIAIFCTAFLFVFWLLLYCVSS